MIESALVFPGTMRKDFENHLRLRKNEILIRRPTSQGDVEGILLTSQPEKMGQRAILFFHGNGELIDDWRTEFDPLLKSGFDVLLVEYRGYGRSKGKPSEEGLISDGVWFFDELKKRGSKVILYGRSLGGGVAVGVAAQRGADALILQSTFASLVDLAPDLFPKGLIQNKFDSAKRAPKVSQIPSLVIHGAGDEIIPLEQGLKIKELIGAKDFVELPYGHNDMPQSAAYPHILRFLKSTLNP